MDVKMHFHKNKILIGWWVGIDKINSPMELIEEN